jgi:GNAT superfamily N-acetyltransferase
MEIQHFNPRQQDAEAMAAVHMESFPNFFLSSLGFRFLKVFYSSLLRDPDCVTAAISVDGSLAGFAVGSRVQSGFYMRLFKRNFLRLSISAALPLLLSPSKLMRVFSNLTSSGPQKKELLKAGCLLSICVEPRFNSLGLGSALIKSFEEQLLLKGVLFYYLTTDRDKNEKANAFYVKNNFKLFSQFRQTPDRQMNIYTKNLEN